MDIKQIEKDGKVEIINKSQSSFKFKYGKTLGDVASIYFDDEEDLNKQLDIIERAIGRADKIKMGFEE